LLWRLVGSGSTASAIDECKLSTVTTKRRIERLEPRQPTLTLRVFVLTDTEAQYKRKNEIVFLEKCGFVGHDDDWVKGDQKKPSQDDHLTQSQSDSRTSLVLLKSRFRISGAIFFTRMNNKVQSYRYSDEKRK
jgi:hypothetical protein